MKKRQDCRNISIQTLCIYNELRRRGCKVDVGMMEQRYIGADGKWQRKQLEVDFVVNEGSQKYYIQSALAMPDEEKRK